MVQFDFTGIGRTVALALLVCLAGPTVLAQTSAATSSGPSRWLSPEPKFRVVDRSERLEMVVNTSRILEMGFKVPRMLVNNTDIISATPLSPNEVQISALKPGFTHLNLWDEQNQVHTVDVLVVGDARELAALLEAQFPDASLKVTPLANNVVISGYAPSAEMVQRIIRIAQDYYPDVINNITVGGAQQVMLKVKVYEVSRTKLRKLGFDWVNFNGNDAIVQNASGLVSGFSLLDGSFATTGSTVAFSILDGAESFFGFMEALRQYNLVKVLAEPNLVAVSGRPAQFNVGGEFPILIPQSLGTVTIDFRQFGTRVDFVPIVLGNGFLRLEVRPEVSEIDPTRSVNIGSISVPGLRTRSVDTAVEMRAGQTLAIAGLIQTRVEAQNRGLPWLSDMPWVGAIFRRVEETQNEIELLVLVTPEFVDAVDPEQVPAVFPGQLTMSPTDCELYAKGLLEVPRCIDYAGQETWLGAEPVPASDESPTQDQPDAKTSRRRNPAPRNFTVVTDEPVLIGPAGYQNGK
ncbi:MAG: histidine kinase [Pirellulaceae bacterium]|nr:MAG: histidine kinase [Pirellulaceae bacterium]